MQIHLLNYSDKCFISLAKYLFEVREYCNVKSVHKLRLSIKELNALFEILNFKEEIHGFKEELNLIDQIYSKSGQLRDNQVQLNILKGYKNVMRHEVDIVSEGLKKNHKTIKKALKIKVNRFNPFDLVLLNQRIDSIIESMNESLVDSVLQEKVNDIVNQINQIIQSSCEDKDLHQIRIKLKELLYLLSILKKRNNKKPRIYSLRVIKLKKIQKLLGHWHDLKVLLERVKLLNLSTNLLIESIDKDKSIIHAIIMDKLTIIEGLNMCK